MKRMFITFILICCSILLSSCGYKTPKKLDIDKFQLENSINEAKDEKELESDISDISVKEDNSMTSKAQNGQNIDYLLRNKKYLQKNESLANFSLGAGNLSRTFKTVVPEKFNVDIRYNKYLMPYDYYMFTVDTVDIYNKPSYNGNVLGKAKMYDKVKLLNEVNGDKIKNMNSNKWFGINWYDKNGNLLEGFVPSGTGSVRTFNFENMYTAIIDLEGKLKAGNYGYISNYKDENGSPPLMNGKALDEYDMQAYQSAPAYANLNDMTKFRYFPDGMLVSVLGEVKGYFKVKSTEYSGEYWIPKKYISFDDNLDTFAKAIVVDTTNQNQAAFEKRGDKWTLISYALATTGVKDKIRYETPLGKFKVMEKKERFYYLDENLKEISGYAPYGIRFSQGAYIHGIPVEFVVKNGKKTDPGIKEYLFTIGTVPRSHKCVRNYTSHAQFLFNWADPNDTAVIVIK
ncbi:L,D-transpeptidase [Sporanaerobacter acetigenes]|uniref:Lipoprotein-anchoring transpeptidase ErfK/SrfK n=1 Tax=Sporanaerobacter acetigenes DSM 13106 TaxID=1123281 RepID=A0A1M5WPK7_9FIRM|nr:L,D-transpeptidase [Sporanaerobacter acetigenes]SHH89490.1 Lipoprotein-anchoring transpeptidase ErfK/SrfK [Sporanaerobacter acetigenes DSM 13106]